MPRKIYVKPPASARTIFVALIVLSALFMVFGIGFFIAIQGELGEARPFVALFLLLWLVACVAIIVHAVKALKLLRKGEIEIAKITSADRDAENGFAIKLHDLESLKKDGLISDDEYQKKRAQIMKEKW